jgi:hypothetical protein
MLDVFPFLLKNTYRKVHQKEKLMRHKILEDATCDEPIEGAGKC